MINLGRLCALSDIREHGITQFLAMWDKVKGIDNDELKWGDEIEYGIFIHNVESGTVRCSLRGAEVLAHLQGREKAQHAGDDSDSPQHNATGCNWVPECGA